MTDRGLGLWEDGYPTHPKTWPYETSERGLSGSRVKRRKKTWAAKKTFLIDISESKCNLKMKDSIQPFLRKGTAYAKGKPRGYKEEDREQWFDLRLRRENL